MQQFPITINPELPPFLLYPESQFSNFVCDEFASIIFLLSFQDSVNWMNSNGVFANITRLCMTFVKWWTKNWHQSSCNFLEMNWNYLGAIQKKKRFIKLRNAKIRSKHCMYNIINEHLLIKAVQVQVSLIIQLKTVLHWNRNFSISDWNAERKKRNVLAQLDWRLSGKESLGRTEHGHQKKPLCGLK